MRRPPSMFSRFVFIGSVFAIMGMASCAHAETYYAARPADEITATEAYKLDKAVYECREVSLQDTLKPKKVKGTATTYHTAVGTPLKTVKATLAEGKSVVACKLARLAK